MHDGHVANDRSFEQQTSAGGTRERLLDEARDLFARHGYVGTSIRAIATATGIRESSVYNHVPSKQALLDAVLDRADARIEEIAAALSAPIADGQQAAALYEGIGLDELERLARGFLDAWLHDADLLAARRILTLEQYRSPALGARLRDLTIHRPLRFQTDLFGRLIASGAFIPADPAAVALSFWGPMLAIMGIAEQGDGEAEARRLLRTHLEHFRGLHIAAEGAAS